MYTNQIINGIKHNDIKDVKFYLDKNQTNLNKHDESGYTPLLYACHTGNMSVVKLLVENGADINMPMARNTKVKTTDKDGNELHQGQIGTTPLMLAAMIGSEEMVNYLINRGADKSSKTVNNLTALDFAKWTLDSRKRLLKQKELETKDFSNFNNIIASLSVK